VYLGSTLYIWTSLSEKRRMLGVKSLPLLRRWQKSMPTGGQYMTLHIKSGWRKVNICQFGQEIVFLLHIRSVWWAR
jgi:hypothetical protein